MPNLTAAPSTQAVSLPALTGEVTATAKKKSSGFSFHDFLDTINPLQHIPVISTLYREITGDKPSAIADILGGALFGGPIGAASAAINKIVEDQTGDDIGGHIMAALGFHHHDAANATAVATTVGKPTAASAKTTQTITTQTAKATVAGGAPKAVPAFLVAEAEADRQTRGNPAAAGSAGQSTEFWRSLQRGGQGVNHTAIPQSHQGITVGPPKALLDAIATAKTQPSPRGDAGNVAANAAAAQAFDSQTVTQAAPANNAITTATAPSPDLAQPPAIAAMMPGAPQAAPRQAIPNLMMEALSKYEAMHKAPQSATVDQVH